MARFKPTFPRLQGGDPLARGLVTAWQCSEGAGLVLRDLSGRGNDCNLDKPTASWVGGRAGSALKFVAGGATPHGLSTRNVAIGARFSVAAWVKPLVTATGLVRIAETAWNTAWAIGLDSAGTQYNLSVNGNFSTSGGTVTVGKWTHIVGTFGGGVRKLYVDGVMVATASGIAAPNISLPIYLNWFSGGSGLDWQFIMDDFRVYDRELSRDEVAAMLAMTGP